MPAARRRAFAVLASLPAALGAQAVRPAPTPPLHIDVTSGALTTAGLAAEGAMGVASSLALPLGDRLRLDGDGTFAMARSDLLRGRVGLRLASTAAWFGLRPTLAVRSAEDRAATFGPSARTDGEFALQLGSDRLGAFVGAGVGRSRHLGLARTLRTSGAGVHAARGPLRVRAFYDGTRFDAIEAAMPGAPLVQRLHDVAGEATLSVARLVVGASLGQRLGSHLPGDRSWGGAWAELALGPRLALVARHETTPSDPSRHLPSQRLSTIGLRLRAGVPRGDDAFARAAARGLTLVAIDSLRRVVRVHAPYARTVEIAGDFTGWEARPLMPGRDGWWETVVAVPPGVHQLNWRTDGGAWRVPPGLEAMRDDYDGTVGVLVIPSP
ncbi:MAG: glycogen-binding domain-containing protein [Gemmatimonadaceae bacterium]|nr:glycogen-binding domain-containing protein [Gemmatimonadaceae bacterium]